MRGLSLTFVIYSLRMGGAERVMAFLANAFAAEGAEVRILTLVGGGSSFYPLDPGVKVTGLDLAGKARGPWGILRRGPGLLRALRNGLLFPRPSLILSFLHTTNIAVLLATVGSGIPVVACERTNPARSPKGMGWRLLRRLLYPRARAVVVLNQRCAAAMDFLQPGKLRVIPNPVFPPPPVHAVSAASGTREPVILAIGRLHPVKRYDLLVRAFHSIADRLPGWRLELYGEGPHRRELEGLVKALSLEQRVFLRGATRDPHGAMRRAALFVLSSDYEGFPNALGEAMACGMAVIAADCETGPREMLTHGVDGLLVPPGDPAALAQALLALALDPAERARLGSRAALLPEKFPAESVLREWRELLASLAKPAEDTPR